MFPCQHLMNCPDNLHLMVRFRYVFAWRRKYASESLHFSKFRVKRLTLLVRINRDNNAAQLQQTTAPMSLNHLLHWSVMLIYTRTDDLRELICSRYTGRVTFWHSKCNWAKIKKLEAWSKIWCHYTEVTEKKSLYCKLSGFKCKISWFKIHICL